MRIGTARAKRVQVACHWCVMDAALQAHASLRFIAAVVLAFPGGRPYGLDFGAHGSVVSGIGHACESAGAHEAKRLVAVGTSRHAEHPVVRAGTPVRESQAA